MKSINQRPFFLAYDIVAGLGLVALAVYSARLAVKPALRGSRFSVAVMAAATVGCGLRGGVGAVGDVVAVSRHQSLSALTLVGDFWFLTAAILAGFLWRALARNRSLTRATA